MTISKIRKIINGVNSRISGAPGRVFNDPINGGRSIKVWGWRREHYVAAQLALECEGFKVEQVLKALRNPNGTIQTNAANKIQYRRRLHVFEK